MSPVRDTYLMLRTSTGGDLAADATLTSVDIEGTFAKGMALQINCPTAFTGTSPILTVTIYAADDVVTGVTTADIKVASFTPITAYGEYIIPFSTPLRTIAVELVVTGTSPNLGAVEVAIVENVGKPWSREIDFH